MPTDPALPDLAARVESLLRLREPPWSGLYDDRQRKQRKFEEFAANLAPDLAADWKRLRAMEERLRAIVKEYPTAIIMVRRHTTGFLVRDFLGVPQ